MCHLTPYAFLTCFCPLATTSPCSCKSTSVQTCHPWQYRRPHSVCPPDRCPAMSYDSASFRNLCFCPDFLCFLVGTDKQGPLAMAQYLSSKLQEVPAQDVLLALHNVPQVTLLANSLSNATCPQRVLPDFCLTKMLLLAWRLMSLHLCTFG